MQSIGPVRYTCKCGRQWVTGATEWDYLNPWDRRKHVTETAFCTVLLSVFAAIPAAIVYFAFESWQGTFVASLILALPVLAIVVPSVLEIAASVWRTRFQKM